MHYNRVIIIYLIYDDSPKTHTNIIHSITVGKAPRSDFRSVSSSSSSCKVKVDSILCEDKINKTKKDNCHVI